MKRILPEIEIMSLKFENKTKKEYLHDVSRRLKQDKKTMIFTPNPQILLYAKKHPETLQILNRANILIPDGSGILLASKLRGSPLRERVAGIDFAEDILKLACTQKLSVFLLGGKPRVAIDAAIKLKSAMPDLKICGCHHGYFDKDGSENEAVKLKIKKANPDIIFVCFGSPLQEKWITQSFYSDELKSVRLAIGLGGSLDVWSGKLPRAPKLFQAISCEWLWRMIIEPKRCKILFDIPRFLYYSLKKKK